MNTIPVDHKWTEKVMVDGASEPQERERVVHLVVAGPSDLMMGIKRSLLVEEQRVAVRKLQEDLDGQKMTVYELMASEILRTQMYPAMVASVIEQEGFDRWPISFELFQSLPEELGVKWEKACDQLNPHWSYKPDKKTRDELEDARKKVMNGTSE